MKCAARFNFDTLPVDYWGDYGFGGPCDLEAGHEGWHANQLCGFPDEDAILPVCYDVAGRPVFDVEDWKKNREPLIPSPQTEGYCPMCYLPYDICGH